MAALARIAVGAPAGAAADHIRRELTDRARREEHARQEAARREAEEKARQEAEEKARREAEEKARREAEEKARREAEEKARREAEEKARQEAEEKARQEAEEKARQEAEEKARQEAEEKARQEAVSGATQAAAAVGQHDVGRRDQTVVSPQSSLDATPLELEKSQLHKRSPRTWAWTAGSLAAVCVMVVAILVWVTSNHTASSGSNSNSGSNSGKTSNSVLTISNENGALWTCGFNPLNAADTMLSYGFVYEPLVYVNPLQQGKTTPMLASSYKWGADNKSLTFTIRSGVKWSDGTLMTAADVAYTFNLIKKYPALDLTGVWSVLSSVTAPNPTTVTMNFSTLAVPFFYYIADQTPIVPEHIWSKMSDPVTNSNSHPIGTGPYLMSRCSPSNITYTANPHYWQPGEPKIAKIQYPAYTSNNTANNDLANGSAQWGAQYIPSIQTFYKAKSPDYHYWFPPTVNVSLIPNLTNPLLSNVKVRQAMSYAINRGQVSSVGESGYEPPANQTGIVTPTFNASLNKSALASWGSGYDPAKAKSLLASAGFHQGSDGVMTNAAGQKLKFSVINIGDYSDWVASMKVIQQDLKAVGIQLTANNLSLTAFQRALFNGKYQLAYYYQQTFGPSAYYELNNWLNSANTAPIGKTATSNYERYSNKSTDALLDQYAATTSASDQQTIMNKIQEVMLSDVPVIPVVEAVDWYQYDTGSFTGWPTPGDPYAQPSPYVYPDNEQVLLHLAPK